MLSFFNQLSIRHKLLVSFAGILLIPLIALIYSNYLQNQKKELDEKIKWANKLENKLYQIIITRQRFLQYESTTPDFFKNNSTELLEKEKQLRKDINQLLASVEHVKTLLADPTKNNLDSTFQTFLSGCRYFDTLITIIKQKGIEDYGLEGNMRSIAHQLEGSDNRHLSQILQIRRKEKDFLLRKKEADKIAWENLVNEYSNSLKNQPTIEKILRTYIASFYELYAIELKIGNNQSGIRSQMLLAHEQSIKQMSSFSSALLQYSSFKSTTILILQVVSNSLGFILSLVFAILIAFHITQPILQLSRSMHEATLATPTMDMTEMKDLAERSDEVGLLTRQYNKLLQQIKSSFFIIRQNAQTLEESNKKLQTLNTELKNRESYLEILNSQKDKFLSMISHDMRGPLVSIMGFMDFYKDNFNSLTEEELQFVSVNMNTHLKRVVEMLDGMLLWSRSQTGELKAQHQILQLDNLVHEVVEIAKPIASQKDISIKTVLIPATIWADKNMVQFMVRNLISNATKFSHPKSSISVSLEKTEKGPRLVVKDNGVGIPAENLQHLFDGHVNKSTFGTAQEQGVGLGIVLCKDFITKCFGNIQIESEVGVGTTVYLQFPTPSTIQPTIEV